MPWQPGLTAQKQPVYGSGVKPGSVFPESLKITLTGRLKQGVYAKDLSLWIIGMIGSAGANYMSIEYHGDGVEYAYHFRPDDPGQPGLRNGSQKCSISCR